MASDVPNHQAASSLTVEAQLLEEIAARVTGPDPGTIAEVIDEMCAELMGSFGVGDLTPPAGDGDRLQASDGRPVHVPPSAVRCSTRRHLEREVAIVQSAGTGEHRAVEVDPQLLQGLDDRQVAAVVAMLCARSELFRERADQPVAGNTPNVASQSCTTSMSTRW